MGRDGQVLECRGLRKRFGERAAVDGVGFQVAEGETYGLLGPNGTGKTTTISMVCGLLARDDGEVRSRGERSTREASMPARRSGTCPRRSRSTRTSPPARTSASSASCTA